MIQKLFFSFALLCTLPAWAQDSVTSSPSNPSPARCEVIPLAEHRLSFQIDGVEKLQWNFGEDYPRPYFYPFRGPSGALLTRMGHPGAPDHDHHQSIWFANNKVNGLDFWANDKGTSIRQRQWLAYQDGNDEAVMACILDWIAPDGKAIMQQELIAAILPMDDGEHALEIQFTVSPTGSQTSIDLDKTNFAFLAVRVAKGISARFGSGKLSNSEGLIGEKEIFAKPARWMDYSGPVSSGTGSHRVTVVEGITFHDHPTNRSYPTPWHVRDDGWMGAAVNLESGMTLSEESRLTLRYLLHAHKGAYSPEKSDSVHAAFARRAGFVVSKSTKAHQQFEVVRREKTK
jgi:Methane oxygenase PmoA